MIRMPQIFGTFWNYAKTKLSNPESVRYIPVPLRQAGVTVDHDTALTVSAYFAGIRYISGQIAGLPWDVIRETDKQTKRLIGHPAWKILHGRASEEVGIFTFKETLVAWALSWGNGYAEIERDEVGRPIAMHLISPDRVDVVRGEFNERGEFVRDSSGGIVYKVSNGSGGASYLMPRDVFHLHGLGFDGLVGYSVISLAARSLGMSIAAEKYGEDFFANGLVSTGALKHPSKLGETAYNRLKKWITNQTGFGKKWEPPILEEGMEWQPMSIPPEDAQMLETRQFLISEAARWLGLPPHKLADLSRATFSNIESQSREVVNDCFMPWIHRLEDEANFKLLSGREPGVRTKMNVRGLLRGDDASRAAYYQILWSMGVYSPNVILELEDMDQIGPEGDERYVQLNLTTLKRLASGETQKPVEQQPDTQLVEQSYAVLLEDAFARVLRRESNRFDQNRHKFNQNGTFEAWFAELSAQQKDYIGEVLRPILASINASLAASGICLNGNVAPIIAKITNIHLESSLSAMSALLSGEGEYEIETRAKREAKDFIERVFATISQGAIQ